VNISIKSSEGEVLASAPDMNLYTVADQVHKNNKIENIEKLKQEAIDAEDAKKAAETPLTEEDAHILADALLNFAIAKEEEQKEASENTTILTDEQVEEISNTLDEAVEESEELKVVSKLPSNNDQEDHDPEEGEKKYMHVTVNPVTGEHIPVAEVPKNEIEDDETFEEMVERVKNSDIKLDDSPFSEEEFKDYLKDNKNETLYKEISKDEDLDPESIKQLLDVVNRKMKGEEFNLYKTLPDKIRDLINSYCRKGTIPLNTPSGNQFRNMIAEQLVEEFISNIELNRIQTDFSKELEEIFDKGTKELSESIVGYTKERSRAYREAADKMEDPEKKAKLVAILDNVDEGYNLETLKEYAKSCKIKKYDLERPDKIYRSFLQKYKDSKFNIYGIDMAVPILLRNLNKDNEGNPISSDSADYFDELDINAFFVAFCKQTANYNPNTNPNQHAYMYYLMYNCIFTDINTGDKKDVSIKFLENVKEVINNLRERNDNFGRTK